MKKLYLAGPVATLLIVSRSLSAQDDGLNFHEDYYLGFSQGVYYGLMLAGVEYDVAWCVKAEVAYEAGNLGAGGEFQARLESIHKACAESH